MRCPKCGYISFDHMDTCLKCSKDIKSTSESLHGSVYHVDAPAFLKFSTEPETVEMEVDNPFVDDDEDFAGEEIRDPDLDILLDDADQEESGDKEINFAIGDSDEPDIELGLGDEEEDGGISFSFEDEADLAGIGEEDQPAGKSINLELPGELSDMSDLEPPALQEVVEAPEPTRKGDEEFDLDLDFDLNLEEEELGAVAEQAQSKSLDQLSLKGLDLDDELEVAPARKKPAERKSNLDDELNFELDLGDLKLDDE